MSKLHEKYPFIVKWSRLMGSYDYYIENQLARAEATNAPPNAIYEKRDNEGPTGQWETTDGITNPDARRRLGLD